MTFRLLLLFVCRREKKQKKRKIERNRQRERKKRIKRREREIEKIERKEKERKSEKIFDCDDVDRATLCGKEWRHRRFERDSQFQHSYEP